MSEQLFFEGLQALAHRCNYQLTGFDMGVYGEVAEAMGWDKAADAIKRIYLTKEAGARFPSVEALRESTNPGGMNDDEAAREIVARIRKAVTTCGWNRVTDARAQMGDEAWAVVEANGGWGQFCSYDKFDELDQFLVQIREHSKVVLKKLRAGQLALPEPAGKPQLQLVSSEPAQPVADDKQAKLDRLEALKRSLFR
jgi:hypothetical protein